MHAMRRQHHDGKGALLKVRVYHFCDNWREENFKIWQSLIDPKYQKRAYERQHVTDCEAWFGRSVEDTLEKIERHFGLVKYKHTNSRRI